MKIQFVCLVWGQQYVNALLKFCLPSLLSSGNLPNWPLKKETTLMIYTTQKDWQIIQTHPIIKKIKQLIEVDKYFIDNDEQQHNQRYNHLISSHQLAINLAIKNQQSLFFMAPDHVYSNGSLMTLYDKMISGQEVVMILSPRVSWESTTKVLQSYYEADALVVSTEQCADLFFKHMHPVVKRQFLNSSGFTSWLSHLYYWTQPNQIQVRCFHLHPVFIKYPQKLPESNPTIDGAYLDEYIHKIDKKSIIQDNNFFVLSLTPEDDLPDLIVQENMDRQFFQIYLDRFKRLNASSIHCYFFEHPITLTATKNDTKYQEAPFIESVDALIIFWKIEQLFFLCQYTELIDIFENNRSLIDSELNHSPFNICYYFAVQAYKNLDKHEVIEELQNFYN